MSKSKIFGVLEAPNVLLDPVSENRYWLSSGDIDQSLVGSWITVSGDVKDQTVERPEVVKVEKNRGKVSRIGTIVADAPNLPPEFNGQGAILYQASKSRYYLLSEGSSDEPIRGDFSRFIDRQVKVSGELSTVPYILYNAKVTAKK
jgi:hypothetical protein